MRSFNAIGRTALVLMFAVVIFAANAFGGFIYVVVDDATGNRIYGYSVNETTGELTLLGGFPVSTGFAGGGNTNLEHLAIDKLNRRLYVANRGGNNISAYSIDEKTGAISPLPFSPIATIANQRTIKVHPSGSPLLTAGDEFASFEISETTAVPAVGSPYAMPEGVSPAVSVLSPDGNYYYAGGNSGGNISGFMVDAAEGTLAPIAGAPFAVGSNNPVPFFIDTTGRLYLSSSRQALMRVYTLDAGVPTVVTGSPFSIGETGFASVGAMHPNGNFFALPNRTRGHVYMVSNSGSGAATTLANIAGSPFTTGGGVSQAALFNESGDFLYILNGGTRNFTTFDVDAETGVITNPTMIAADSFGATGTASGFQYVNFSAGQKFATVSGRARGWGGNAISSGTAWCVYKDQRYSARLSHFGYFTIENIPTGITYFCGIGTKMDEFEPQIVTVNGNIENLSIPPRPRPFRSR